MSYIYTSINLESKCHQKISLVISFVNEEMPAERFSGSLDLAQTPTGFDDGGFCGQRYSLVLYAFKQNNGSMPQKTQCAMDKTCSHLH